MIVHGPALDFACAAARQWSPPGSAAVELDPREAGSGYPKSELARRETAFGQDAQPDRRTHDVTCKPDSEPSRRRNA
jgi:hypothetical protein